MNILISEDVTIDAEKLVTGRTCVIGQSGSGKSYTVAVICEELAKNNIGFCIIDTEGEYFSLKEKYPVLWIGSEEKCDLNIDDLDYKKLAKKALTKSIPLIFDVSEVEKPKEKISKFLKELYTVNSKLKHPYLIIVEEADKFAPQKGNVLPILDEISRRGRKRGIGLIIASQRPALVNKNILSQCGNQIIGKLTIQNDIDSVKIFFSNKKNLELLPHLKAGQFFVQGEISIPKLVMIRKRETTHKAITPKLKKRLVKTINLEELETELKKKNKEETGVEEVFTIGIKPQISFNEALQKIKKKTKRFRFFGKEALISNLHIVLRPVFICDIKYLKKKLMEHTFLTIHSYFDGITGNIISLDKGFSVLAKIDEFLGLDTNDLEVFKIISSKRKVTTTEIAYLLKRSPESVRISLKKLIRRGLITYKKIGRNRIYLPFTKLRFPTIKKISKKLIETSRLKLNAKKLDFKASLKDLIAFVRSLGDKVEIISEKKVYYPFYTALIIKNKSERRIFMDAVTGKFVKFSQ